MKLPEFALTFGRQGCNSCFQRELVTADGKIFKGHFDIIWIFLEHLIEYQRQPGTVRSLKVIENGNHHGCIFGSLKRSTGNINILDEVKADKLNGFVFAAF